MATQQENASDQAQKPEDEMHTLVDRMLSFIQEHNKTTVAELADVFAMDQAQVERLATVLEESGLITMRYALLHPGRTELIAIRKAGAASPAKASPAQRPPEAREHDFELREMMKSVDMDMAESQQAMTSLERDVMSRLARTEKLLGEIERRERSASPIDVEFLMKEADTLELMRRDMSSRLKIFEVRIDGVGARIRRVKHAIRKGPLHMLAELLHSPFKHKKKDKDKDDLLEWTATKARMVKK
ncbi:MAG: helix-turn-helix domain-containing protein [Candidatus Micrarchaeia archaeon]|jgi:DNA-binding MarR family transcriptional regulator